MDCVFCRIRDGQIPSTRVYEDERTIAFMDINPLNEGHTLVISRAHAATLYEADEADLQAAIVDGPAGGARHPGGPPARRPQHAAGERGRRVPVGAALPSPPGAALHRGREGLRLADGRPATGRASRRPPRRSGGRSREPGRGGGRRDGRGGSGPGAQAEDPGGEARPGRPRPGRQDRGARAPGRGHGGRLHRPPPEPRGDRRDGDPGGRGRHRALGPVGRPQLPVRPGPRAPAGKGRRRHHRLRGRHRPPGGHRPPQGGGRAGDLHARHVDARHRRLRDRERSTGLRDP